MALDPSIALGVRPVEVQNPLNQFAQAQQIQAFQRQNELANRAIEQEEILNRAYASSINPVTGQIDANKLRQNMATGGIASKLPAAEKSIMEGRKLGGEVDKLEYENKKNKYERSINDIINFDTHDQILGSLKSKVDAGELDVATANRLADTVPQDPAQIPAWQIKTARGLLNAKDKLEQQFTSQDYSGGTRVIATSKFAGGSPAQVVPGSDIKKTATIADQLAREKFNWEKANPGFELKETENGDIVGVNKRTLQAFPVTVGGAAPVAPAAAPMGGSPRVAVNNLMPANAQVIPGMNSVLDQRAPVAPVTPVMPQMPQANMPLKGARKEAPAKFNDTDMQLAGLAGSLKEFKDEVGKNLTTGAKFLPSGADTARMQAKYTALLMGVKDLYTLGALTGPDMAIVESQITNPASWSGKFTTKKGFDEQTKVIEDMLQRSAKNLENTYGRTPKATKSALEAFPGGVDGGISGATANDPLGFGIKGR
jgi:hypothetical protein